MKSLEESDPEIYDIIQKEKERQMNGLEYGKLPRTSEKTNSILPEQINRFLYC